jgi:hypothetical protein
MSDPNFAVRPTGDGLVAFLDRSIQKGDLKVNTGQAMKTAVKEVLSSTEGEDGWESVDLDALDVEDVLRRFETLRAMKFSSGSLNTYKSRFQKSLSMFAEFRTSPGTWRPSLNQRSHSSKKSETATRKRASGSGLDPGVAPAERPADRPTHGATIITYPFPVRDGVLASIELPADLTSREARRLAAFVDSLAVDEPSERQGSGAGGEEG